MQLHIDNIDFTINKPIIYSQDSLNQKQSDLFENLDSGFIKSMIKSALEGEIVKYLNIQGTNDSADVTEQESVSENLHFSNDSKIIYRDGKWKRITNSGISDSIFAIGPFYYTGRLKIVLGYTSYEIKMKDSTDKTVLWVCKDLPTVISPVFTVKGIDYAMIEYLNPKNKSSFVLRSLKVDQKSFVRL